jgi:pilus assembly protein CpaE
MAQPEVKTEQPKARITVLVVDRTPESRATTTRQLATMPDMELVGTAADGDTAVLLAREVKPDVVIMDVNLPGIDGLRATELLTHDAPSTAVVLISDQNDVGLLRRGMQAGARDFLSRPLGPDDLVASVRSVYEQELQRRSRLGMNGEGAISSERVTNGKVLCVFSPKGGVGRTTMSTNLAIAIRQLTGCRVALVDCNLPFGDIGIVLNLTGKKTISDLLPTIADPSPELLDSVMAQHESGIDVLLAPTRPELAELFHPEHIRQIFEALRKSYDYVVVDTWASFHEVILALFDVSSEIVLLTTLDMPAVKNIRMFLDVCDGIHYPKDRVRLVLNRADSTGGLRIQEIEESIQHKVASSLTSGGSLVTTSINRGVPFILSDPEAPVSRDVFDLANQVLRPEDRKAVSQAADFIAAASKRSLGLSRLVPGLQSRR